MMGCEGEGRQIRLTNALGEKEAGRTVSWVGRLAV